MGKKEEIAELVMQALANGEIMVVSNPDVVNSSEKGLQKSTHPTKKPGEPVAQTGEPYDEYNGTAKSEREQRLSEMQN